MPATSPPSQPHTNLSHHPLPLLILLILLLSSSPFSYSPLKQKKLKQNATNPSDNGSREGDAKRITFFLQTKDEQKASNKLPKEAEKRFTYKLQYNASRLVRHARR
ncbi:hypothetical protein BDD12DRAFT_889921 [Trichophaea hybrida]|nr:hypothetical protein BDD12DRAFT_889921 [Trichophaea hybrida]